MGATVERSAGGRTAAIKCGSITNPEAPYDLVRKMRASSLVLGPVLARFGEVKVSLPGGCAIGARPINLHLKALEKMGAEIRLEHGYVHAKAKKLRGAHIIFDTVTVTGTENIMMAATLADGTTTIENAACEPEVTDLADLLRKMGARISGDGTEKICVEGVKSLGGAQHSIIPDRIETGTFIAAAVITRGDLTLTNANPHHIGSVLSKMEAAGARIVIDGDIITVSMKGRPDPVSMVTSPFPGFPTDMQAQFMAVMCIANGTSIIRETIFENRFMHVLELQRMGASISIEGNSAVVNGLKTLSGAEVMATDLRASASLIIAGLAASGKTAVSRIYHLDRGYEKLEKKLKSLGAGIRRVHG
jgi:UDP-N-acetylglucosamine 1-carboxyvinyltransferase